MVGASSSFSQSRRQGWENAYVDYETLKILLTHIELVYEQSNYNDLLESEEETDENSDLMVKSNQRPIQTLKKRRSSLRHLNRKKKALISDYRDQLFLESDSSDAFDLTSSDVESKETSVLPSNANFSFDTKGLLYDLDVANPDRSLQHDETTPIFNMTRSSYRATDFHADDNIPVALAHDGAGMNWISFNSNSHVDASHRSLKIGSENRRSFQLFHRPTLKDRRKKKKKVPPHLKIAHAKARAITKRFLGLLSSEVEKVSLFVHARLGELADTMGSLRFSNDEGDALGRSDSEYPMSDGGFHSSSSSDGSRDSSDTDDLVGARMSTSFEAAIDGSKVDANPFSPSISRKQRNRRKSSTQAHRQDFEEHYDRSGQPKPLFQRSDAVFGEDLSLLSAVDEADGYASVGIEMVHLLRFIMVNALAVRKLCLKHDRLLSNRMLGGYHHKEVNRFQESIDVALPRVQKNREPRRIANIRKDSISEYHDYSARTHGKTFSDYRRELSLRLQENHFRLLGIFDSQLQALMTSATSLLLSESLRQALYDFEVSMCRARALSNLNASQKKPRANTQENANDDSAFCYYFPQPLFDFSSKSKTSTSNQYDQFEHDVDDESTASSSTISLFRLRFVVASILGWQEASKVTRSNVQSYLARTMLCYDSCGHLVGDRQGFDGCSRETLDFLMSYNSDMPFGVDDCKPFLQALRSSVLETAMLTCLAISSGSYKDKYDVLKEFKAVTFNEKVIFRDNIFENMTPISARLLIASLLCSLVSTMNVYVIVPSAFSSAVITRQSFNFSVMMMGSSIIGGIISFIFQCLFLCTSRDAMLSIDNESSYLANMFLLISTLGFIGNTFFSYAISEKYSYLVLIARLFVGMTFCDPIAQYLVSSWSQHSTKAAAAVYLKACTTLGVILGFLLGSVIYIAPFSFVLDGFEIGVMEETVQAFIFSSLWIFLMFYSLNLCVRIPKNQKISESANHNQYILHQKERSINDSPGSDSQNIDEFVERSQVPFNKLHKLTEDSESISKVSSPLRSFISSWNRSMKWTMRSSSLPSCFYLLFYASTINELILLSFPFTMSIHFGWNSRLSGLTLTAISMTIVPTTLFTHNWNEVSKDRALLKRCIFPIVLFGVSPLIYFDNACAIVVNAISENLFDFCSDTALAAIFLPIFGSLVLFVGCSILQNASLSIISKTATSKMNRNTINAGILKIIVVLAGKLFGYLILFTAWMTYRLTGIDFINFIAFSALAMILSGYQRVKKVYFFLNN